MQERKAISAGATVLPYQPQGAIEASTSSTSGIARSCEPTLPRLHWCFLSDDMHALAYD